MSKSIILSLCTFAVWGWVGHGTNVKKEIVGNEDEVRIIVSRSHAGKVKETAQKAFGKDVTVVPAGGAGK